MTGYDSDATRRLLEKVRGSNVRIEPGGCWTWLKRLDDRGNAIITLDGVRYNVRRVLYAMAAGESVNGRRVRMTCDNRVCVNPAHMAVDN